MRERLFYILNLSVVSSFVILGFSIIAPVLPQYALSFSVSVAMTGWAVSSFALARLVMDIPGGMLAERFGRKRSMMAGLVLVILSSLAAGTATTFTGLIVGRVIQGLGSALYMTAAMTWLAQNTAGEQRGRFMALYSGSVFMGTAFGPTIGGYAAAYYGLNAPFFLYGMLAALGLLATIPLKEGQGPATKRLSISLSDITDILRNRSFLLVNTAVIALFFLRAGVRSTLIPLYASLNLGLQEEQIGIMLTVAAVATSLVAFPSGWLSDKIGRKGPIVACLFLSSLTLLLIPLQESTSGLITVMALYGLSTGLQGSIAAWPADVAPENKLGTAMGIYRVAGDIGFVLGPITVTYIAQHTGSSTITFLPFLVSAIVVSLPGLLVMWARDPAAQKKKDAHQGLS